VKIVVTGPPLAGKSTLAVALSKVLNVPLLRTDALIEMEWSAASEEVAKWLDRDGPWIIEGVTVPRAIRKWRRTWGDETPPPFDKAIVIPNSRLPQTSHQKAMGTTVMGLMNLYKGWIGDRWIEV
jgi:hypothetical protein